MSRLGFVLWLAVALALAPATPAPAQETTVAGEADNRIPGLMVYEGLSARHSRKPIAYEIKPPVGGDHHPIWQNCGYYTEPVPAERAVHSLEHGAVWITYQPGLNRAQLRILELLALQNPYVLVSPYPDLPAPVVASAWGAQVYLEGAEDDRLSHFLREFAGEGPEVGGSCTGGRSRTIAVPADTPIATPAATPGP